MKKVRLIKVSVYVVGGELDACIEGYIRVESEVLNRMSKRKLISLTNLHLKRGTLEGNTMIGLLKLDGKHVEFDINNVKDIVYIGGDD